MGNHKAPVTLLRLLIGVLACALVFVVEWQRPVSVERLDEGLRDAFLRMQASDVAETRLVVVDINEASLAEVGAWPWPRGQVANMVEILIADYSARAVGLDIVFPQAESGSGDLRLAALAEHAPLALAQIFDYTPRSQANAEGRLSGGEPSVASRSSLAAYGYIANHPGLAQAHCVGNISYAPDHDGVLRRTPAWTSFLGKDYPQFADALLRCTQINPTLAADPSPTVEKNRQELWRVPYTYALSAYTVIPAADILNGRAARELVAGRYVLVGSSALGLGDQVSTPLAPLTSGVMVHAASLSGLLDLSEGRLQAPWTGRGWLVAWSAVSLSLALGLMARLSAWRGLLLLLVFAAGWVGIAFAGVARQAEWSVTAPLWGYLFLLVVAVPFEWWLAQRQTRQVLRTFSHYVAQPVLDEIVRLGLQHSLQPRLCDVTVLIADMEGYTRATSDLSLDDAAALTKDFLACLTRPVLDWRGTLDKYTGDGLVAFWGAPIVCSDQADRAVSAALAILAELNELNALRKVQRQKPVKVRIGIESGRALVGDLGTAFRSTYTAVGDCINFASRLESAARDLHTPLVIGAVTKSKLTQHSTLSLGHISLRGTQTTIEVFTIPSQAPRVAVPHSPA